MAESREHQRLVRGLVAHLQRSQVTVLGVAARGWPTPALLGRRRPDVLGRYFPGGGAAVAGEAKRGPELWSCREQIEELLEALPSLGPRGAGALLNSACPRGGARKPKSSPGHWRGAGPPSMSGLLDRTTRRSSRCGESDSVQDLYACSIVVNDATHDALVRDAILWAWRGADDVPAEAWSAEHAELRPGAGQDLTIERLVSDDRRGTVIVWRHPDREDPGLRWRSTVEISDAGRLRLTVRIAREAVEQMLAPAAVTLRPPRLVRDVLARYDCEVGEVRTNGRTRHLATAQVDGLIEVLRDSSRSLPVLIVAANGAGEIVDGGQIAGLADVVQLGRFGWEALRDRLGYDECFAFGGARLYWPAGSPRRSRDRRFWRNDVAADEFAERLRRMLSSLSTARTPADPVIAELRRARIARIADLRSEVTDVEEFLQLYEEENTQLKATVTEQADELERLRSINEQLKVQLQFAGAAGANAEIDTDQEPPSDWAAFAQRLPSLEGPGFAVTDRAKATLDCNPYPGPARMWTHLSALAHAGATYHDAAGGLGSRLKEWMLQNHGIEISLHDGGLGDTAFEYGGQMLDSTPHVKVDDHKKPNECGRIYFALDKVHWCIVVDHIGLHR